VRAEVTRADAPPPDDAWHINSAQVSFVAETALPWPEMRFVSPQAIIFTPVLPENLPVRDESGWVERLTDLRNDLLYVYEGAETDIEEYKALRARLENTVGDPAQVLIAFPDSQPETYMHVLGQGRPGGTPYAGDESVAGQVAVMVSSFYSSMGYVRSVADIGPIGLNVVFIFMAMGWIVFVTTLDLFFQFVMWLLNIITKVIIGGALTILKVLISIARLFIEAMRLLPFIGIFLLLITCPVQAQDCDPPCEADELCYSGICVILGVPATPGPTPTPGGYCEFDSDCTDYAGGRCLIDEHICVYERPTSTPEAGTPTPIVLPTPIAMPTWAGPDEAMMEQWGMDGPEIYTPSMELQTISSPDGLMMPAFGKNYGLLVANALSLVRRVNAGGAIWIFGALGMAGWVIEYLVKEIRKRSG